MLLFHGWYCSLENLYAASATPFILLELEIETSFADLNDVFLITSLDAQISLFIAPLLSFVELQWASDGISACCLLTVLFSLLSGTLACLC